MEDDSGAEEGYDHRTAAHERHDRNHRIRIAQGCIICKVSNAYEYRDERNRPTPSEGSRIMSFRIPEHCADYDHDQHLIQIEPALHEHRTELPHHKFIIQTADSAHDRSSRNTPDPFIAPEVDILLLSCTAHHEY